MWIFTISTGTEFPSTVAKHSSLWTLTHRCCYTMLHQVVKGFGTHASWCTPVSTIVSLYVFSLTYYDSKTNLIWLMTYTSKHAYWSACQHHFSSKTIQMISKCILAPQKVSTSHPLGRDRMRVQQWAMASKYEEILPVTSHSQNHDFDYFYILWQQDDLQ